jgi:pimeloyl-ACP methyl ester carboxylesterase
MVGGGSLPQGESPARGFRMMSVLSHLWLSLGWLFGALFGLLTASMVLLRSWAQALVLLLATLLCLPPVGSFLLQRTGVPLHPLLRGGLLVLLLSIFAALLLANKPASIYRTPAVRARLMEIYDEKMASWPVPFEDVWVGTDFGPVHVVASGEAGATPLLLLHASGVGSWSWKYNIADLSRHYRCYAIDLIGDAGKSEYASLRHVLESGRDQASLYRAISDRLGATPALVVGASEGGFIATNYALHHPERVSKLALLGPMGYAGATRAVIRITIAQLFPLRAIHERTFSWAFSDHPVLEGDFGEWFRLVMSGLVPAKVPPWPFSSDERQRLAVPVLFVFGTRDHLVGDPAAAATLVRDIPGAVVRIVEAGHLMAAEKPAQVDALLSEFFGGDAQGR